MLEGFGPRENRYRFAENGSTAVPQKVSLDSFPIPRASRSWYVLPPADGWLV